MSTVGDIQSELQALSNPEKAAFFPRFFKAGPGQYAEGDQFIGVPVPVVRTVAKKYGDLALHDVAALLDSQWHEARSAALFILVAQYRTADALHKKAIYDFYLAHTHRINNWDLVDSSAEYIVGPYLENRPERHDVLSHLAGSESVWERRIAMLATFDYIKKGNADEALVIAEQLLYDQHDLIQKAVGWMLREIGKRVDREPLLLFLNQYAATMPRTTLRYAIEHLSVEQRTHYRALKGVK